MSEISLYRKYRPAKFAEVIGQETVIRVLSGALKLGNVAHAYLFAGSRGTGKTSIARILARELETEPEDLYEIDGASNRGIDEIRALREAVGTMPFRSPRKVYIIDEVHMLTRDAFNALLKTLEEPPAHVVFILATTELNRVPETIISRCQSFTFAKPSLADIRALLERIAKSEKIKLEVEASELLALIAEGSFRDAVGLLQQAISASRDNKITLTEAELVTGAPAASLVRDLARAIIASDIAVALATIEQAVSNNHDIRVLIRLTMRQMRLALLINLDEKNQTKWLAGLSGEEVGFIKELGKRENTRRLPDTLRALLSAHEEVGKAVVPSLPLELALVGLASGQE